VLKGVAKKAEVFEVGVGMEGRERTEISEKVEDIEGEVKREGGDDSEWVEDEGEYIEVTWPIAAYQHLTLVSGPSFWVRRGRAGDE
jgi:hypothetical protein